MSCRTWPVLMNSHLAWRNYHVNRNHPSHILVIALLGGFSGLGGGPFYGTGYYGGGLGLVLVIVLILVLLGRL